MGANRWNPGCNCCPEGCTALVCVTVVPCDSSPKAGHRIDIKRQSDNAVVATCNTDFAGKCCQPVPPGAYYVKQTPPFGGASYPGKRLFVVDEACTPVNLTLNLVSQACVTVTNCGDNAVGAVVSLPGHPDKVIGPGFAAVACFNLTSADSLPLSFTVTYDGRSKVVTGVEPGCSGPFPIDVTGSHICLTVYSCANDATGLAKLPLPGATVSAVDGDGNTVTATTDAAGVACLDVPGRENVSTPFTISAPRYATQTFYATPGCPASPVFMVAAVGYGCCPLCVEPVKLAWAYTDANGPHSGGFGCYETSKTTSCTVPFIAEGSYDVRVSWTVECYKDTDTGRPAYRVAIGWTYCLCPVYNELGEVTGHVPRYSPSACGVGSSCPTSAGVEQVFLFDQPCYDAPLILTGAWPATVPVVVDGVSYDVPCPAAGGWIATEA